VHVVWNIALAFASLVLCVNGGVYIWRWRLLRALPACDAVDRLGVIHAAAAFIKECIALAAAVYSIPFGWLLPRCRSGPGGRGPLILVHGWGLNSSSLWCLRYRLRRDGWSPVCCFANGRKGLRPWDIDVEGAAAALRQMIQQVTSGQPLALIGHGVGGLVVRYCIRRYPLASVRRIVTLGTPHGGTALARRGPWHTLAPGAPLLNKLNAVDHVPQQFDVIAIHSTFDAIVVPPTNATYPGAFNIQVNNVGHHALLFSSRVYQLLVENLAAPLK